MLYWAGKGGGAKLASRIEDFCPFHQRGPSVALQIVGLRCPRRYLYYDCDRFPWNCGLSLLISLASSWCRCSSSESYLSLIARLRTWLGHADNPYPAQ